MSETVAAIGVLTFTGLLLCLRGVYVGFTELMAFAFAVLFLALACLIGHMRELNRKRNADSQAL